LNGVLNGTVVNNRSTSSGIMIKSFAKILIHYKTGLIWFAK